MIALQARPAPSPLFTVASPFLAIALTLATAALMLAAMERDPGQTLWVYFVSPFMDGFGRAEIVVKAVPLALIGAGLSVCFRANVWNIGAAGQFTAGAIAAGGMALAAPDATGPFWLALFLGAGALGGMACAAIPAALRTRFNANEILVSLMLTYVAALLLDMLVRGAWRSPLSFGFPQTDDFADAFVLPTLLAGTRLHWGVALAVVAAVALQVMMTARLRGFAVRVVGAAPRAGAFAGFSTPGTIWFAFLLSGGLAGLAGAIEVSAVIGKLQPDIGAVVGFSAIIVAFLGRLTPLGALLGAVLLAVAGIGGENAQILLKLPKNVTGVFQGLLLFFLLACDTLIRWRPVLTRRAA